jgi:hypothetical protein
MKNTCPIGARGERLDAEIYARLLSRLGPPPPGRIRAGEAAFQPSASLDTVAVLGVPSTGRLPRSAIRPILERTKKLLSRVAPLPHSLEVKEGQRSRPW